MAGWLNAVATAWLDVTLAAALVSGGTALAMIQCRQPARRRVWGRLGLGATLVVIPLVWLNPLPRIDLSRPPAFWGMPHWSPTPSDLDRKELAVDDPSGGALQSGLRLVLPGLILAYGVGLVVTLGRLGLGLLGTRFLLNRSGDASMATVELLTRLPFDRPERGRPTVRVSPRLDRPVLVGVAHPAIVIPPALDRPEAEEALRLGLLHELAHAEIDDQRFVLLANLAHAVWFFLPPVSWIRHQLRLDAEFLADHRAVGSFGTSDRYAASLVGLAELAVPALAEPTVPSPSDSPPSPIKVAPSPESATRPRGLASALFQRVQMLLKCPFEVEDRAPRAWSRGVAGVVVAVTLLATAVSVRPAGLANEPTLPGALDESNRRGLDLAELAIAPDRPFDLRFRLPAQFALTCEVFADPRELHLVAILGYRLAPDIRPDALPATATSAAWHRVEVARGADDRDILQIDGQPLDIIGSPSPPATTLTIRPIPGRLTRFRNLHLSW